MRMTLLTLAILLAGNACHAALPTSLEEFQQQITDRAADPKAAVGLWFDAIYVFTSADPVLGAAMITEMTKDKAWETTTAYMSYALENKQHILRSYAAGTTPDDAYAMDPSNYQLVFSGEPNLKPYADQPEGEYVKLFVASSGADAPRPITVQRNAQGLYKVYEASSIFVDVRPPTPPLDESLPESTDPGWVMRRFFEGLFTYMDGNQAEGAAMVNSVSRRKSFESEHILLGYLKDRPWMFGGFVVGTSPEEDYKFDRANWELNYAQPLVEVGPGEETRASLRHSGADVPKPVYLTVDERGQYRIRDYSNVYSSCRLPGKPQLDASIRESTDPAWVMRRFFEGIFTYLDGDPAAGAGVIDAVSLHKDFADHRIFVEYLKYQPWMFGGFIAGTSPEEDYKFDRATWELNYVEPIKVVEPGQGTRALLRHSGADFPKPIYLVRDERGEYRIRDYGNVYSSCRRPGKKVLDESLPESSDPAWVMRRFFEGLFTYIDGDQAEGKRIVQSVSLSKDFDLHHILIEYLRDRPWMFGGFVKGTTPEGEYKFDRANWELSYAKPIVPVEPGQETRASLKHSGADIPKPIYLARDERGEYRIRSYANVYSSCRLPGKKELDPSLPESTDPLWVMRRFFEGILAYTEGKTDEGRQIIESVSVDKDLPSHRIFVDYMKTRPWMFAGFFKGTTYVDGYKFDRANWELNYAQPLKLVEPGQQTTASLRHSGADIPKPIYLVRDERGEYRIRDFGNVYSSCRPPQQAPTTPDIPESTDPVWVAKHWLQGVLRYVTGDKTGGLAQMAEVSKTAPDPRRFPGGSLEPAKYHIWRSYVKGATPENSYRVDDIENFEIDCYFQPGEDPKPDSTWVKLYIRSSGAASARPMRLDKDTRGQWRVAEFSSLCSGIVAPGGGGGGNF